MEYTVRKALMEDLPRIEEIYAYAREVMVKSGNPNQWGTTEPPHDQLVEDIRLGDLYVIVNGADIHGVFYFWIGPDKCYAYIEDGAWQSDATYGTIHRIASDGSGGILRKAMEFCATLSDHIRIDTHHDNKIMQNAVAKLNFKRSGIIYVPDGSPRIAYEWDAE